MKIYTHKTTILSIEITRRTIVFIFDNKKLRFRNFALRDSKWHTIGFAVSASDVVMTTDCVNRRRKKFKRKWPSNVYITNSTVFIGSCASGYGAFKVSYQGYHQLFKLTGKST